jgi:hypothetical protein
MEHSIDGVQEFGMGAREGERGHFCRSGMSVLLASGGEDPQRQTRTSERLPGRDAQGRKSPAAAYWNLPRLNFDPSGVVSARRDRVQGVPGDAGKPVGARCRGCCPARDPSACCRTACHGPGGRTGRGRDFIGPCRQKL